jgi:hypothetical protein
MFSGLKKEYLREWLPVFINVPSVDILQIFDIHDGLLRLHLRKGSISI